MLVRNTPTRATSSKLLPAALRTPERDRKSTRLNSSHRNNSYAVFCLINMLGQQVDQAKEQLIQKQAQLAQHIADFGKRMRIMYKSGQVIFFKLAASPAISTVPINRIFPF